MKERKWQKKKRKKERKEMATHSSTLAWKIPWTEKPAGYSPWGREESDTTFVCEIHEFNSEIKLSLLKERSRESKLESGKLCT